MISIRESFTFIIEDLVFSRESEAFGKTISIINYRSSIGLWFLHKILLDLRQIRTAYGLW